MNVELSAILLFGKATTLTFVAVAFSGGLTLRVPVGATVANKISTLPPWVGGSTGAKPVNGGTTPAAKLMYIIAKAVGLSSKLFSASFALGFYTVVFSMFLALRCVGLHPFLTALHVAKMLFCFLSRATRFFYESVSAILANYIEGLALTECRTGSGTIFASTLGFRSSSNKCVSAVGANKFDWLFKGYPVAGIATVLHGWAGQGLTTGKADHMRILLIRILMFFAVGKVGHQDPNGSARLARLRLSPCDYTTGGVLFQFA